MPPDAAHGAVCCVGGGASYRAGERRCRARPSSPSDANDHASEMLGLCRQLTKAGASVVMAHHTPLSDLTRQKGGMGVLRTLDSLWALYGVGERGAKRSLKDPERFLACLKLRRQEDAPDAPLRLAEHLATVQPHAAPDS